MREIKLKLYQFTELPAETQQYVLNKNREMEVDGDWWLESCGDSFVENHPVGDFGGSESNLFASLEKEQYDEWSVRYGLPENLDRIFGGDLAVKFEVCGHDVSENQWGNGVSDVRVWTEVPSSDLTEAEMSELKRWINLAAVRVWTDWSKWSALEYEYLTSDEHLLEVLEGTDDWLLNGEQLPYYVESAERWTVERQRKIDALSVR